jgi:hypothetical protein
MEIRKFFIASKHWQLFLLMCGFIAIMESWNKLAGTLDIQRILIRLWIPWITLWICVIIWLWCWGDFLNFLVPKYLRLKLQLFRVAIIYIFLFIFLLNTLPQEMTSTIWGILLGLFYIICGYYIPYFLSKSLLLAETGKQVKLYSCIITALLFFFIPIGIWFIQPRINRLFLANKVIQDIAIAMNHEKETEQ